MIPIRLTFFDFSEVYTIGAVAVVLRYATIAIWRTAWTIVGSPNGPVGGGGRAAGVVPVRTAVVVVFGIVKLRRSDRVVLVPVSRVAKGKI